MARGDCEVPPYDPHFGPSNYEETSEDWTAFESGEPSEYEAVPAVAPQASIATRWASLAERPDFLCVEPPRQEWLLMRPSEGREVGVLPRGRTGLLVGAGGTGKTMVACQLAAAVTSGGFLFDTFRVVQPGHVVLALAEEELEECQRRLYRICAALELSTDQRKDLSQRLHILPLAGVPVSLLRSPGFNVWEVTDVLQTFRRELEQRQVDWKLVLLDPLARWAGGGAERDNEAATRFAQAVERLTDVRGRPNGLVVHHSSQASIASGASTSRGVTALPDGFRWVAGMDAIDCPDGSRGVLLRNLKSNYSPKFPDLLLAFNEEPGTEGTLRLASERERQRFKPEAADRAEAKAQKQRESFEAECVATLERIPRSPEHITFGALKASLRQAGLKMGDKSLGAILQHLSSSGGGSRIVDLSNGRQSAPRQWARAVGQ